MAKSQISLTVNGKTVEALVEPRTLLIHFLREQLMLTGEVAAAGENMPPKSTYFFPKLLTGLLFNPLS